MEIYYFSYFILFVFVLFDRKHISVNTKRYILYYLCVFYSIIGGFGDWSGMDWDQYYRVFQDSKWNNIFTYSRSSTVTMEPGYMFLNVLCKTLFFGSYSVFLTMMTFFYLFSFTHYFLKNSRFPITLFVIFFFLGVQFIVIRQSIAIAILLWAVPYIQQRNLKKFLLFVLAAILIHNSSISFVLVYWFYYIPANYLICNVIFISSLVFANVYRELMISLSLMIGGGIAEKVRIYQSFQISEEERSIVTNVFNIVLINLYLFLTSRENSEQVRKWLRIVIYSFIFSNILQEIFLGTMSELARLASNYKMFIYIFWLYIFRYSYLYYRKYIPILYAFLLFYLLMKFYKMPFFVGIYVQNYIPYEMTFL